MQSNANRISTHSNNRFASELYQRRSSFASATRAPNDTTANAFKRLCVAAHFCGTPTEPNAPFRVPYAVHALSFGISASRSFASASESVPPGSASKSQHYTTRVGRNHRPRIATKVLLWHVVLYIVPDRRNLLCRQRAPRHPREGQSSGEYTAMIVDHHSIPGDPYHVMDIFHVNWAEVYRGCNCFRLSNSISLLIRST